MSMMSGYSRQEEISRQYIGNSTYAPNNRSFSQPPPWQNVYKDQRGEAMNQPIHPYSSLPQQISAIQPLNEYIPEQPLVQPSLQQQFDAEIDPDSVVTQNQFNQLKKELKVINSYYKALIKKDDQQTRNQQIKDQLKQEMALKFPTDNQHYQIHAIIIQRQWREYQARKVLKSYSRLEFEHSLFKYRLRFEKEQREAQNAMLKKLWEQTCVIFQRGWYLTAKREEHESALLIQNNWRMFVCRRWYKHQQYLRYRAAVVIQTAFRKYMSQRQ